MQHNDTHRVKFNGGERICLDCNKTLVELGIDEEQPPRVLSVVKNPDGTYHAVGFGVVSPDPTDSSGE